MAQSTNEQWLDVMYAVQRFVRERLDAGALDELPKYLTEHQIAKSGQMYTLRPCCKEAYGPTILRGRYHR